MQTNTEHVPLPLKYRPSTFSDVVGQEHVVRTLRHAIEAGRIANAYLFIGPRGIGKTTLSRIFAKALNCQSPNGVEPCGNCDNCNEISAGRSIDVTELDAASHNKVEDVKPIIESVHFKPVSSKYKIFIIDECHMLTNSAWNALLKTLEEPPPHVRFIFATTEGDKVLATIVSRCQRFDLRRIQTNDIAERLKYICQKESIEVEEDALLAIARGAEGGMRDALSSLDQLVSFKGDKITEEDALGVFGLVSRSALEELAGAILAGDTATILSSIDAFDSAGKNMRRLSGELLQHFRNLVVLQALGPKSKSLTATPEQIKTLEKQASGIDAGRVFRVCDQIAEMEDRLRYVLSVRTLIEMSLIRASRLATTATIDELLKVVREVKNSAGTATLSEKVQTAAPKVEKPSAPSAELKSEQKVASPQEAPKATSNDEILNDPTLNDILYAIPGATITDIKGGSK
ncbi:MAG: DNA polymerase III subunit gamma/tau [Kiritimatiellae bacterium]|nr:DNA polymerase III subunit gamma/tau [Kiritimatiellia bacterium]